MNAPAIFSDLLSSRSLGDQDQAFGVCGEDGAGAGPANDGALRDAAISRKVFRVAR
jgi:hypothetical protein